MSAIAPVAAQADVTPLWSNEIAMVNDTVPANRATMILDPGRGSRLTRAHVLARSFRYESAGFDKNFLWYAQQSDDRQRRHVLVDLSRRWAGR